MAKINSRSKGQRGERLWRDELIKAGFSAKRGGQQGAGGSYDSPDVICPSLNRFHQEVKFVEKLNLRTAMEQAINDAQGKAVPIVVHKIKNGEWLVTMQATEWLKMAHVIIKRELPHEQLELPLVQTNPPGGEETFP